MPVALQSGRIELPEQTRARLENFRRRLWIIKTGEGLLTGLFGLLASYAVVFVLDRFFETPAAVRGALLVIGSLGLGIAFPLVLHRWVWGTRRLEQVARLVRRRFPRLGDQLLGIVELAQAERDQQACSDELLRAAVNQVDKEISQRDITDAAPATLLRRWSWATGIIALVALVALLLTPAASFNALARWLMPWRDVERYTFAQLNDLPAELVVPYAEEFSVNATLREGTAWKPQQGEARLNQSPPVTVNRDGDEYSFTLPPRKEPDQLTVKVGDARREVGIRPMTRPELTAIMAHVKLPDYLGYPEMLTQDVRGGATSAVRGSFVHFEAAASRPLAMATADGHKRPPTGDRIITEPRNVDDSFESELSWRDEFGLEGKRPLVLSVEAKDDAPPTLACDAGAFEHVLLEDDVLTFQLNARDDFGVQTVGMVWAGIEDIQRNPHPVNGERILVKGEHQSTALESEIGFSPKREAIAPQTLKLRMFTVDYLPDRERVYSPEFIVHVLSPEEHNIWLTRQLSKWFRSASEVYDKERALNDQNIALRGLSAEELSQPDNQRRLEQQAAAEQANARRLNAVTGTGKELIREALKNEEFNPQTLETWAEMLNSLQQIADERMPSVADLLAQAAKNGRVGKPATPQQGSEQQSPQNPGAGNNRGSMPPAPGNPKTGSPPPVPGLSDVESGFNKPDDTQQKPKEPSPASSGRLSLPVTTLQGGGPPTPEEQEQARKPPTNEIEQAVGQQQDLLDEFARVADELQKILDNLEGSTFVKRLKAASRRELELAGDLNATMLANFGQTSREQAASLLPRAEKLAERQRAHGDNAWQIESDMKAYFDRVHDGKFKVVLDEMAEENPVGQLAELSKTIGRLNVGEAISGAEFWADTFDRWAEQLVGPACKCNGQCPPGSPDSLPPHVILAVMRILEKEINLRDETRTTESTRAAMEAEKFGERAESLSQTQVEIVELVVAAIKEIEGLETAASFGRELVLLTRVKEVMREAAQILARPDTGPEAIAAETEAIELLLQAKRINPKGGGNGGMSPGGGGRGDTKEAALALIGDGDEHQAHAKVRRTEQSTGVTGRQIPAEFRSGLDAFFGGLEGQAVQEE